MKKDLIQSMVETAILVALAVVLDLLCKLIPFFNMPQGGHISLSMLPIMVIGFRRGLKYGLIGGFIYSILNFLIDGIVWHLGSIIFDYIIAFTVLGLTGLFKGKSSSPIKMALIMFVVCFLRYLSHGFSGAIFFAQYAYIPESLNWHVEANMLPWVYSFVIYNLPYMGLSTIFCIVIGILMRPVIFMNLDNAC